MSYFYSVNRDNPLGYFSIDFNYRYSDFDPSYTPYGGTVNPTPGSSSYGPLTRTNLCTNPNSEIDISGYTMEYNPGGLTYTFNQSSTQSKFGTKSFLRTMTSGTGASQFNIHVPTTTFSPSTTYTASVWVYTNRAHNIYLAWNINTGGVMTYPTTTVAVPANTWTQITNTNTTTTGLTAASFTVFDSPVNGDLLYIDGIVIEQGSSVLPYFDGSYYDNSTSVYASGSSSWTGVAGASTSTFTGVYSVTDPYRLISNYGSISQFKIADQSYINNVPTVFGINYSSPIVSGNKYAAQITTNSSLDVSNLYDAFVPASESDTWSAEFWASLDWMDGQGINSGDINAFTKNNYRTDIGFRSTFNSQAKVNLLDIGYYTGTVWTAYGSVVYNQSNNCIEFYIPKTDKSYAKAYAVIRNLDVPMHIYVSYSNKTINVIVNGETGISASVDGLYSDPVIQNNSQNLKFRVSGEIYNPLYPTQSAYLQNGQYFLISNLAFYNYTLNSNQINNHMRWAAYDNKPMLSSVQGSTHFFSLEESQENFQYKKTFTGKDFNNYTQLYNLSVNANGLSPNNVGRISFNNIDGTSVLTSESDHDIYSVSPDPGVSWIGGIAALEHSQFGYLMQSPCTISLMLEPYSYNTEYIFSISGVNGISTLYVERSGTSTYSLVYFDATNGGTSTTLASVTSDNTKEYHKIALSITGSSAQLTCVSSSSQNIASASDPVSTSSVSQGFSFTGASVLVIGQSYHNGNSVSTSNLRANCSQFSYFGLVDSYLTDFSYTDQYINGYHYSYGFPWTQTLKYSSPLQYNGDFYNPTSKDQSFPIYQIGYWITTIPLTSVDGLLGSKIDWNSTNSCLVEYSFYNSSVTHQEQNWYTLSRRGSFVSGFDFTKELANMLIRVTILSEYDVNDLNQTFNNLQVGFYRNMNFYSDNNSFVLQPQSSSIYNSSYTIKGHAKSIQSRSNNLGILFPYSSHDGNVPGFGKIVNTNAKSLQGVDFWFRPDTNYKGSVILSALSSVSNFPHLYANSVGALAWNSNISKVYVNGQSVTNASSAVTASDFTSEHTLLPYNPIHIVVIFSNNYSGNLYVNGAIESTSTQSQTFDSTNQTGATSSYSAGTTTFNSPTSTTAQAGQNTTTGTFTVVAGRTYTITAKIQEVVSNSRTANPYIQYYNSSGTLISTLSQTAAAISSTPTSFTYATTAPTGATYAAVGFQFNSVHVNEVYNIINLAVTDSVAGNLTIKKIGDSSGSTTTNCTVSYNIGTDTTTVTINSFASPVSFSQNVASNRFTIAKKAAHYISASVAESSAYTTLGGTRSAAIGVTWIDASGTIISTTIGSSKAISTTSTTISVLSFPPDNAVYGNYNFYLYNVDISESYTMTGLTLTLNPSGSESSYGFINLWDNIVTPTDPVNRYALFTTNTVALYSNDNYLNDVTNKLSFDSAKESLHVHKIGN